jgi:hypothetical protein
MLIFGPRYDHSQFFVVTALISAAVELGIIYVVLEFERREYGRRRMEQLEYLKNRSGAGLLP